MKILQPLAACIPALSLTGCPALDALAGALATPLSFLSGMASAVTRTVSQADAPGDASNPEAVSRRGSEIAALGTYGDSAGTPGPDVSPTSRIVNLPLLVSFA